MNIGVIKFYVCLGSNEIKLYVYVEMSSWQHDTQVSASYNSWPFTHYKYICSFIHIFVSTPFRQ